MPKLKPGTRIPTREEDAAINAAIAADDDAREMMDEDFARAKIGAAMPSEGKTRITIWIDSDVLDAFKAQSEVQGRGYQTLINEALRRLMANDASPVTEEALRRILREELHHA